MTFEPRYDKTNTVGVRPAKTQISLGIHPVWSGSSPSAWRKLGSLATHWAYSEDSDQTGWMPRLIWVFAGRTLILLVLSGRGSFNKTQYVMYVTIWQIHTLTLNILFGLMLLSIKDTLFDLCYLAKKTSKHPPIAILYCHIIQLIAQILR